MDLEHILSESKFQRPIEDRMADQEIKQRVKYFKELLEKMSKQPKQVQKKKKLDASRQKTYNNLANKSLALWMLKWTKFDTGKNAIPYFSNRLHI